MVHVLVGVVLVLVRLLVDQDLFDWELWCRCSASIALFCECLITLQFSRTVAPDTSKGPALIAFMQHNKWRKIVIISSTENVWIEASSGLSNQLEANGIDVFKPAAFEKNNFKDATLIGIRRSGIRIVLSLVSETEAKAISMHANRARMTSAGWAWLLTEERASVTDMAGWLFFRPFLARDMQVFAEQVSAYSNLHFQVVSSPDTVNLVFSAALYDAVMLYAHAATTVMSKGDDLHDGKAVTAAVRDTNFTGVAGTVVALDSKGDRTESYEVMNYVQEEGNVMSSVGVGVFDSTLGQYRAYEQAVVWPGKTMEVPLDYFSGERLLWMSSATCFAWHALRLFVFGF